MNSGGEPRRLVAEARAQKLLDRFGLNRPSEIVLEDIAYALGIEITYRSLTGADAHLVRVGNKGGITISERIKFFEATDALCVREREHLLSLPYTEALIELGIR